MGKSDLQYQRIKKYVADKIMSAEWPLGFRIPTEEALVAQFDVSRMTVHRAIRELVGEGLVRRQPGAGTFVTNERPSLDLIAVRNIAEEIRERGHGYSNHVALVREERASPEIAQFLGIRRGGKVFHSVIVHLENEWPIQLENRYVNPKAAPLYLKQNFNVHTPNEYLMTVGPLDHVEHLVEAVMPDSMTRDLLRIPATEPCLLLHRRTWSLGRVVSRTWLTHPGSRYRLGTASARSTR